MKGQQIVILGSGGHARVVAEAAELQGYKVLGFVDERITKAEPGKLMGFDIRPRLSDYPACAFIAAVGDNRVRKRLFQNAIDEGFKAATVIHPAAVVSRQARIGAGTMICAGAIVSVFAEVGENTIINTAASVDHDCHVESHTHLAVAARLAGGCIVGEGCLVAVGAKLVPGIELGAWSVVAAGAVVVRNVAPHTTVMGVPAKPVRSQPA